MLANLYPPFPSPCCDPRPRAFHHSSSSLMMADHSQHQHNSRQASRRGRVHPAPIAPRSNIQPASPSSSSTKTVQQASSSSGGTGRQQKQSNRSRAGCWTCRGRKVKCDEEHPRCGPCVRLGRPCDWGQRWNFSDATTVTQEKYKSNVLTAGNTVWDPEARPLPSPRSRPHDDLPSFSTLNNDDDRERKAVARSPGTYAVVVTPASFADLPEYASSASSPDGKIKTEESRHGSLGSTKSIGSRSSAHTDPNVVILDVFEDAASVAQSTFSIPTPSRRTSVPDGMQSLSISTAPPIEGTRFHVSPFGRRESADDYLVSHFRRYIAPRLVQPLLDGVIEEAVIPGSSRDVFEIEAARFPPLHHAICAISALNLAYSGRCALEDAMQHYHQALSTATTPTSPDDLISDGVFLRHFLLFIYDVSVQMSMDHGGSDMWAEHLTHLRRIAIQRHTRLGPGREPHAYTLWSICELDMYACLLGNGHAEFIHTVIQQNALPSLEHQIPVLSGASEPYSQAEAQLFPMILALNQGVVIVAAKIAQMAQSFRLEAEQIQPPATPGSCARWQASAAGLQNELSSFWEQTYPDFLRPESAQAGAHLPERVRSVFHHALLLYQATQIYLRTSMFPTQPLLPTAAGPALQTDTDLRSALILTLTTQILACTTLPRRTLVFPIFMAGTAASQPDMQARAVELITLCERKGGVGQNTFRTRQLLQAVVGEQRERERRGLRREGVEWMRVGRERGLGVVNCGL